MRVIPLLVLITLTLSSRFCLYSFHSHYLNDSPTSSDLPFGSYHPQYLHSYSYPQPSTFHLYFGRVEYSKPTFIIQQGFQSVEKQVLVVNDQYRSLTSAHTLNPNHNVPNQFMLMLSIEDSYPQNYTETASISLRKEKHIYSISMKNRTETKAYILYFTENGVSTTNFSVGIRDVSDNPKSNWRLSRTITWATANQKDILNASAIAIQIDTHQSNISNIQIHFKEVPINTPTSEIHDWIAYRYDREYHSKTPEKVPETCASAAINRIFEGLSYQYGNLKIINGSAQIPNEPRELLSFSPSRKRFPWGFLWDDGFHNEIAIRNNKDLSFKVIKSWLSTMIDGWIPRQQNRGKQREELCNCAPYMTKDIRDGNPPTLILPLEYMVRNKLFLPQEIRELWVPLRKWYQWYLRTQMNGSSSFLFKWFDHLGGEGSFNSGLDDFPRPQPTKYHIDAQSWIYEMSRVMGIVAKYIGQDVGQYEQNSRRIKQNLKVFIEPTTSTPRDVSDSFLSTVYSQHLGYPSLLPLAFGMLDLNSPEFKSTINLITNTSLLNTTFGLSSISQSSPKYLQDNSAYWRGPIWININYLVLKGLKLHYPTETKVYDNLRSDLLKTVCGEWTKSGYFFQNYVNGSGNRLFSYPFNGWTSLISIISQQNY